MINYLLLAAVVIGLTVQNVTRKSYNSKVSGGTFTFSAGATLCAVLVFLITSGGRIEFAPGIIPYAIMFAASYVASTVFMLLAIKEGSLALTSLIIQYSLIIPTVFGFVLWGEKIRLLATIGLVLLVISLALINLEKRGDEKNVTPKWLIYVVLAFLGNGFCSTSQKAQQIYCDGQYKNEFMILALSISFIFMMASALFTERENLLYNLKRGLPTYSVCGIANGLVNYLVLVLSTEMAASVMFPVISAGGIVTTYLVSLLIYKEKMSRRQTIGLVVGAASIIVLNL